jgi:hypothetical protein
VLCVLCSRNIDEEEQEEAEGEESALDYYMHRHAAAFRLQRQGSNNSSTSGPAQSGASSMSAAAQSHSARLMALQRAAGPTEAGVSSAGGIIGGLSSGSGVSPGGSPVREEAFAMRRSGLTNAVTEDESVSRAGTKGAASTSKAAGAGGRSFSAGEAQLYDDLSGSAPWNADYVSPPVLPGQYVAKHRHDQDKQEVLSQVVELERVDMLPIILACEFSLCVYYARTILLRSVAFVEGEGVLGDAAADANGVAPGGALVVFDPSPAETSPTKVPQTAGTEGMGLTVLTALVQQAREATSLESLCSLFAICFKQHVITLVQPDRLMPLLMNGNAVGDARDRVPPFAPFLSTNILKLNNILAQLELQLFAGSEGSLAVEDTSIQGLQTLSHIIDVAIHHARATTSTQAPPTMNPSSSISSNLSDLQTQLLRNMGVTIDANESSPNRSFGSACKTLLAGLVRSALDCLQTASTPQYDNLDWFSLSLDRHEKSTESSTASLLERQAESSCLPVAFAYWLLRSVLVKSLLHSKLYGDKGATQASGKGAADASAHGVDSPAGSEFSPGSRRSSPARGADAAASAEGAFELLTSADTLSALLKLSSSQNLSLRFCIYDLSALILSRVNTTLCRSLRQAELDGPDAATATGPAPPTISAAEYYITIAKEKRLLQVFGARLKSEGQDRGMFSRFTRAVGAFLFQWHALRRQLGLSSLNYMHEYLMSNLALQMHRLPSGANLQSTAEGEPVHVQGSPQSQQRSNRPEKATAPDTQWTGLRITQLTSNSVTVDWRLDDKVFKPSASLSTNNGAGLDAPLKPYDANLYFTAASHMGLETPVLVLSNLELAGTFHIDDLEADTLYKITISKENPLNASSDQEDDGEQRRSVKLDAQQGHSGMLSFFDNGAAISTPHRELLQSPVGHESPTVDLDRKAPDVPIALPGYGAVGAPSSVGLSVGGGGAAGSPTTKVLAPFPALTDLNPVKSTKLERSSAKLAQQGLLTDQPSARDGALVVREDAESAKDEVVVFISTECDPPFQFDTDQLAPHLSVAPHSLTLHNTANKKWSTARASARLTSGIHRWDVHIDRCVSKNIFIGVATKEARLDNYVGCDKHGWAFLANKAVWHNKAKVKAYGELFRTGDTVTVIVDLDEGTLSYNLNSKPMGVALEGLTGPLYPAFSLYNEDDQITVVQVATASGDSSGGAGSCAAEKVLERVETFNCLLQCVTEAFDRETGRNSCSQAPPSAETAIITVPEDGALPIPVVDVPYITEELGAELLTRWELWKAEIPIRSFMVGNDLITVCGSAATCTALSKGRLRLWEQVSHNSERAVLIGASQHKLWFRNYTSGELSGVTADALDGLLSKGALVSIETELANQQDDGESGLAVNEFLPILKSPTGENLNSSMFFSFEISAASMKEALLKLQSTWKLSDDGILLNFLVTTARMHGATPFNLNVQHVVRPSPASTAIEQLWIKYSEEDVALRALFLIHLNDLALPLLPLLCPYSNAAEDAPLFAKANSSETSACEAAANHPTWSLKEVRHLLFPQVKREFAERLAVVSFGSQVTIVRPPLSVGTVLPTIINDKVVFPNVDGASAKSEAREASAVEHRYASGALQSILTSLGEDSRRYMEPVDSSPGDRVRQQQSASPYLPSLEQSLGSQMSPSTSLSHPTSFTAAAGQGRAIPTSTAADPTAFTEGNVAKGEGQPSVLGIASSSAPYLDNEQMLVLEVTEELRMGQYLYNLASEHGVAEPLLLDDRWKFLSGFQCSFVGQMMSFFEQVAGLNANCVSQDVVGRYGKSGAAALGLAQQLGGNAGAWENYLRSSADSLTLFWVPDGLAPKQRSVPFLIRATKWPAGVFSNEEDGPRNGQTDSKLFQLLALAERNPEFVSEWSLFAAFVDDACTQVSLQGP